MRSLASGSVPILTDFSLYLEIRSFWSSRIFDGRGSRSTGSPLGITTCSMAILASYEKASILSNTLILASDSKNSKPSAQSATKASIALVNCDKELTFETYIGMPRDLAAA
nr:hypothetical protein Iba_chr01aCG1440 [Ipomoea batatas]